MLFVCLQIIAMIEELVMSVSGGNGVLNGLAKSTVDVTFIESAMEGLRGFVGLNRIYFNDNYFREKRDKWPCSNTRMGITFMDLTTLAVHECSHLRMIQHKDELNFHNRDHMELLSDSVSEKDIGKMAEEKLFGKQINWFLSKNIDTTYLTNFQEAIESGSQLPELKIVDYCAIPRESPSETGCGADLETN